MRAPFFVNPNVDIALPSKNLTQRKIKIITVPNKTNNPNTWRAHVGANLGSPKNNGANTNCVNAPAMARKITGRINDDREMWVKRLESFANRKKSFSGQVSES